MGKERCALNTVKIHIILKAQVPSIVLTAGYTLYPRPRMQPVGISYKLQMGSSAKMHKIRMAAMSTTPCSPLNSDAKKT